MYTRLHLFRPLEIFEVIIFINVIVQHFIIFLFTFHYYYKIPHSINL